MRINGTNINDLPEQLLAMANAIASLIDVTDLGGDTPEIGYDSSLDGMRGVPGVFFEHRKGSVIGIYAGGTDISEIVATSAWNECEDQAQELYIDAQNEQRTAAAQNRADIKAGK
jgi:hypothetical protein